MKKALAGIAVVVAAVGLAAFMHPLPGPLIVWPAVLAMTAVVAVIASWPAARPYLEPVTGAVGVISAMTTIVWMTDPGTAGGPLTYFHTVALLVLIALTVRWAPWQRALPSAGLAAVGEALLAMQVTQPIPSVVEGVAFGLFWSFGTACAVGLGAYLRVLDARRVHAVREARRSQRVHLARDLHDFVAHDVSAMVIQAQAAQILMESSPAEAAATIRAIEQDGARALAAMDRTVRMLRELEGEDVPAEPTPGLDELPDLVRRFAEAGFPDTGLEVAPPGPVPREVAATIYRVVVEALTNVRKHAPAGSSVSIRVTGADRDIVLTVADRADAPAQPRLPAASRSGVGLAGLAERVEALGGTFSAGRAGEDGWVVKAVFP